MYPRVAVDTELGPVTLAFTTGTHVHVSTDDKTLTYRGKQYSASVHLHLQEDGTFAMGEERSAHIYRTGEVNYSKSQVLSFQTPTLFAALVENAVKAANAYATEHPEILQAGAEDQRTRELDRLSQERAELVEKLAKIDAEIEGWVLSDN